MLRSTEDRMAEERPGDQEVERASGRGHGAVPRLGPSWIHWGTTPRVPWRPIVRAKSSRQIIPAC